MTEIETETLKFTDAAARKVGDLIRGEGNPNLKLRVFVQGGGCSGMQYGFEFDEQEQEGDTGVENLGVKLLIDPMSVQYLTGAEIDYREGLDGAQFVIRNPNAQTTCGCGGPLHGAGEGTRTLTPMGYRNLNPACLPVSPLRPERR